MKNNNADILTSVREYYTQKIKTHGTTPLGVDWNSLESQQLRFEQLLNLIIDKNEPFSILDYGCGFGALYEYMKSQYAQMHFNGFDISERMIEEAKKKYSFPNTSWNTQLSNENKFHYVVASGIFNVKLENNTSQWLDYVFSVLNELNAHSTKGFAFNMLTHYSDAPFMKDYLFYANPAFMFDYCKMKFSKNVALLHDYPLYEFTILIKK